MHVHWLVVQLTHQQRMWILTYVQHVVFLLIYYYYEESPTLIDPKIILIPYQGKWWPIDNMTVQSTLDTIHNMFEIIGINWINCRRQHNRHQEHQLVIYWCDRGHHNKRGWVAWFMQLNKSKSVCCGWIQKPRKESILPIVLCNPTLNGKWQNVKMDELYLQFVPHIVKIDRLDRVS